MPKQFWKTCSSVNINLVLKHLIQLTTLVSQRCKALFDTWHSSELLESKSWKTCYFEISLIRISPNYKARNERFFILKFQQLAILLKKRKFSCFISCVCDKHFEKLYDLFWVLIYLISIWAKPDR